jgi:GH25 family lysozyme M1 (1,4-beta-N-acetylmuramidase)
MAFDEGVDVASYQPVDYPVAGKDFAFVKSTQGTSYVNPEHDGQIRTIVNAGGVPGHYHFMTTESVASQVNFFVAHTKVNPGDMIALDWETLNGVWPSNSNKDAFLKALKDHYPHNKVGLYTNRDGWLNQDRTNYCGDFLWIADPGVTPGSPRVKHAWTFHQYGESHGIDLDVANFSTLQELKNWAGIQVSTPDAPNATYKAVMLDDVFPISALAGTHQDGDGNGAWTLQTVLSSLYGMVYDIQQKVDEIHTKVMGS